MLLHEPEIHLRPQTSSVFLLRNVVFLASNFNELRGNRVSEKVIFQHTYDEHLINIVKSKNWPNNAMLVRK